MKRFCDLNFPEVKFANDVSRRAFLVKKNIRLQKDDKGAEGVCVPKAGADPDEEKEIKIGKRLSASKIRQEDFGDGSGFSREQRESAHAKNSAGLMVQSNSQAGLPLVGFLFSF